jgi:SAM-dependent methyltransferase
MRTAIEYHSDKAADFAEWHEVLERRDYFASSFAYGRWRIREALRALLPLPVPGLHFVDIGCGTGHELALFLAQGYEVTGVEPAEGMRAEALRLHPELAGRVLEGSGEALPLADEAADVVLSIEVVRYIVDLARFAREVGRVLRSGGAWFFTATPPTNWCLHPLLSILRSRGVPLPHVQRLRMFWHSAGLLRRVLSETGFEMETVLPVNYIDFPCLALYRALPRAGALWAKMLHPAWSWMERHRLLGWAAGYYVVKAVKRG